MADERVEYRTPLVDSGDAQYSTRLLIGIPTTGTVRMEWVQARYGQVIPINWSQVEMLQWMDSYVVMRYQVADAQNLIVRAVIENGFDWVLFYEHDVCPPPNAFILINEYIRDRSAPIVSGLYYTRSRPSEPLVFRGRGNSFYGDWQMGDQVWCDGVPTGILLVDAAVLRAMWDESPEYIIKRGAETIVTRRVFDTPRRLVIDPEGNHNILNGTSDLDWCTKVMKGDFLRKAGWGEFADAHPEFPFMCDTRILCRHININGEQFP